MVSACTLVKGGLKMPPGNICTEYGRTGIQSNGIGPGYITTDLTIPLREPLPDGPHPFDQFIEEWTPEGRRDCSEDLMDR